MELGLKGKVALVTGGSHGLGKATARALVREGTNVAICGRNLSSLEFAANQIREDTHREVLSVVADVRSNNDIKSLVDTTVQQFGHIDILVNNADSGPGDHERFFDVTDEDWLDRFNVKLLAAIRLTRLIAPHMMESGWGRIINLSGASAHRSGEDAWTKGVAHAGIINLTKRLSTTFGPFGITVNAIEPGRMWTDGLASDGLTRKDKRRHQLEIQAELEGISFEEMNTRMLANLVIGRRVEPEDDAEIIVFLASEQASVITGELIVADGGETGGVRY